MHHKSSRRNLAITVVAFLLLWVFGHFIRVVRKLPKTPTTHESAVPTPFGRPEPTSDTTSGNTSIEKEGASKTAAEYSIAATWATPRSVWGLVVDENGIPLPGATIVIEANDVPFSSKDPEYHLVTDTNGRFSLLDKPAGLMDIYAKKDGYYSSEASTTLIAFSQPHNVNGDLPPTKDEPTILVLRKKGTPTKLIHSSLEVELISDGTPVEIDLTKETINRSPNTAEAGSGDLKFEFWGFSKGSPTMGDDWICRVTVPRGGLIERTEEFEFEAPESEYRETVELRRPAVVAGYREYFVKTHGHLFARVKLDIDGGPSKGSIHVEGLLNPDGTRNLESDVVREDGHSE